MTCQFSLICIPIFQALALKADMRTLLLCAGEKNAQLAAAQVNLLFFFTFMLFSKTIKELFSEYLALR